MPLLYTTNEAIMRRLKGRIELAGPTALGRVPIDAALLAQVAEQAEERLNNVLRKIYQMPLQRPEHPTLAEYVELRSVCALIPVHFQRQNVSDDRGLGEVACKDAEGILKALQSLEILLPGEILIPPPPQGVNFGQTVVRKYTPGTAEAIQW
ncbi:MAG TPA: hypothetical protein V6D19_11425 [Stenomitos sp.]